MGNPTRILVVDDEPETVEVFSSLLREEGYEVWSVGSGQEALKLAKEKLPDVVVLDLRLPDLNGVEVCRRMKNDPNLRDTFVVILSGVEPSASATVTSLEIGADDYIAKPVDVREFTARIHTIIRLQNTTAALRESEQHYRNLIEVLPDGVLLVDAQARILSMNPQALSMLGYESEAELAGKSVLELVRIGDRERMRTEMGLTSETGLMRNAEYQALTRGGMELPVSVSATVRRDGAGKVCGLIAVMRDSTERQVAEALLRQRAEFSRSIIRTAMDGFWMVDLQGRLLDANESYCVMSGYTLSELLAMRVWELDIKEQAKDVSARIARIVKTGADRFESKHRRKDGKALDVEVSTTYLPFGEGYVFAFLRDISKRKQAEEELMQLPRRILAAQEAERLRVSRDLHDGVNQTIASAKMRLHSVLENRAVDLGPSAKEILVRCERLMAQALQENRAIAHNLRPSDLDELGFEAACRDFCSGFSARTKLSIRCRIAALQRRLPAAVELNLFRILQEALNNVHKHAKARKVEVRLALENDSVVLSIRDDGGGIRNHRQKNRPKAGNGQQMGILGMKERAALLGGSCEFCSRPNQGTTVKVTVPYAPQG